MDIAIADVTDVPEIAVGDAGGAARARERWRVDRRGASTARWAELSEYEVTCGMSKRVPRTLRRRRAVSERTRPGADAEPTNGAARAPRSRARRPREAAAADADAASAVPVWVGVKDAGAPVMRFLDMVGGHLILVGARARVAAAPAVPRSRTTSRPREYIGFGSLPIVLLVGAFTGMVMSLQSVYAFRQFGLESFSGGTTGQGARAASSGRC